jgi:hypothetical protein
VTSAGVTPIAAAVPPHNLDAEESLLGALMLAGSGSLFARVADTGLNPGDFYRESHGRIYKAILSLYVKGDPVDAISVSDELGRAGDLEYVKGAERIHELAGLVPAMSNAPYYATIIRDHARRRDLIRVGNDIARLGWDGSDETDELLARARALVENSDTADGRGQIDVETWAEFASAAGERVPCLVEGLWPVGALGFVAAPPKKGKTWIGLDLAVSIAAGKSFLNHFDAGAPEPVIYLALEGHRAAIRTRVGALAHGHGLNPDTDLARLHFVYKPRGINLANPSWVQTVRDAVNRTQACMIIVDVLRAAALIKENSNEEFNALRAVLQPINDEGCSIALLHHFGKLTEITKERTPGERMSGTGAMYGAMDVGIFITAADKEARSLKLEFELRDLATPDALSVKLAGDGHGDNGGFVYGDAARWEIADTAPDEDGLKAPPQAIYDWLIEQEGQQADSSSIRYAFEISDTLLRDRSRRLEALGVVLEHRRGKATIYRIPEPADEQMQLGETPEVTPPKTTPEALRGSDDFGGDSALTHGSSATHEEPPNSDHFGGQNGSVEPNEHPRTPHAPLRGAPAPDGSPHPENEHASTDTRLAWLAGLAPDEDAA